MLPDNHNLSLKRLHKLKGRLSKNESLLKRYDDVFKEQLRTGIIEEVEEPCEVGMVTYLPHKEVVREDKESTKLRIVFDASAKVDSTSPSLNEILYKGPCLNPLLYELLLTFRVHPIAITADIEKAYLQIVVNERHRDYLRFLWYKDVFAEMPEIVKYRFTRVIFGAAPSQFLLNGYVRKHVSSFEKLDPEFVRKIRKGFYVDDLCTGVNNVSDGFDLYKKIKLRFDSAHFNVRKWKTNSFDLMELINGSENGSNIKCEEKNNEKKIIENIHTIKNEKVLGIEWNLKEDCFVMGVSEILKKRC